MGCCVGASVLVASGVLTGAGVLVGVTVDVAGGVVGSCVAAESVRVGVAEEANAGVDPGDDTGTDDGEAVTAAAFIVLVGLVSVALPPFPMDCTRPTNSRILMTIQNHVR